MIFGAFGVHRFFLGQWWGILYLLTFWTLIPSIISFVEAIVFWCANTDKWDVKYNQNRPASPNEQIGSGVIIVMAVAVIFVGVAILGILAAIAIPAYQNYTIRAQVGLVMLETNEHKIAIERYYQVNNEMPASFKDIGISSDTLASGNSIKLNDEGFMIWFDNMDRYYLDGKNVEFKAYLDDDRFAWDCTGGTLTNTYRTDACRLPLESNGYD